MNMHINMNLNNDREHKVKKIHKLSNLFGIFIQFPSVVIWVTRQKNQIWQSIENYFKIKNVYNVRV